MQVTDLWKSYGSIDVLKGISLHIRPGEIYDFVGANGAGKSTTMRTVIGVTAADAGEVSWLALIQRTEDLHSAQAPIMFPIFVTLYTPAIFFGKVDTWWMQLFAWLPPLSIGNAPLQYASGYMNLAQFSLSMLLMAVITAITVYHVAKIYKFAILNNGSKISWGKALSGATRAS